MRPYLLILISLAIFLPCSAQETKIDSVTYLEEVVIYYPLETNVAIGITPSTVIREKAFQNFSPIDIASSINQISGVYLLSGAMNTNRITIRGVGARTPFGTNKLRLYYNDIPVTNGTGSSTIEAFDLENLGAIEVIKGPKGTAYGSNLGGAILLKSKVKEQDSTTLVNNFTLGSYGLIKNNLGFEHQEDNFSMNLRYNHLSTDGYRENNEFERDGLLLNSSYFFNPKSSLNLLLNYINYTAQIPSSLSQTAFDENPKQAAFTWREAQGFEANKYTLLGLSYSHNFTANLKNTSTVFYSYLDHYEPRPFNILDEFTHGYGFRTHFSGILNVGQGFANYTLGAELLKDEYNWSTFENLYQDNNGNGSLQGDQLSDNIEYRRQFNAFGTFSLHFNSAFNVQLGLNINKTHYDFRDLYNTGEGNKNAKRSFDVIVLPNLDLEYAFKSGNRLFANISRGFSNPSLEETLTPDGVINPDIQQETGTNIETGAKLQLAEKSLRLKVAIYNMNIKNLLVAQRVGQDQFIGKNAGSTRHQGFEIDMDYTKIFGNQLKISPFLSYTFSNHNFIDFIDGDNDYSGNPLTGVPKHRLNTGLRLENTGNWYWNTTYQFVGEIPLTDANTLYSESYNIVNTRLGYIVELSKTISLGLDFGVNNIFDEHYARSVLINAVGFGGSEPRYFYPGNERNYYGSLNLKFQL